MRVQGTHYGENPILELFGTPLVGVAGVVVVMDGINIDGGGWAFDIVVCTGVVFYFVMWCFVFVIDDDAVSADRQKTPPKPPHPQTTNRNKKIQLLLHMQLLGCHSYR